MAAVAKRSKPEDESAAEAVAALVREDKVKLSDGSEVTIRVCKTKDIPKFTHFIGTAFNAFGIVEGVPLADLQALLEPKFRDPGFILKLISEHTHEVFEILALLSNTTPDVVGEWDIDDTVAVAIKVFEVNYAFFTQRVLPMVQALLVARTQSAKSPAKP